MSATTGFDRRLHAGPVYRKAKSRFVLAGKPGPNTLRVRLTLTGAKANTPVLGTLSRFDIAGGVTTPSRPLATGKGR